MINTMLGEGVKQKKTTAFIKFTFLWTLVKMYVISLFLSPSLSVKLELGLDLIAIALKTLWIQENILMFCLPSVFAFNLPAKLQKVMTEVDDIDYKVPNNIVTDSSNNSN